MKQLVEKKNIDLVMIYRDWFRDIPESWVRVGDMHLGKMKITPARSVVGFYVTDPAVLEDTLLKLKEFTRTLPEGVDFVFARNNSG
ncbi:MAG: hypothetical protein R3208_21180 [Ketobacteraceae bacterium]|nr:hypothetical protein [Ketobacteraceae bacterium]